MKKILMLCVVAAMILAASAQNVVDNFIVGPYEVDYMGDGEVKYRLLDNIDLYEFFELDKDTIIEKKVVHTADLDEFPLKQAWEVSGYVGFNRFASKEVGIDLMWKRNIATNLYFNGGLEFGLDISNMLNSYKRTMFEAAIPLQVELGKLNFQRPSLYGLIGVSPTVYATVRAKNWDAVTDGYIDAPNKEKKAGFLISPQLEVGGNLPLGGVVVRLGVYFKYKVNCTPGDFDIYHRQAGRAFFGTKIGVIF